MPLSNLTDSSQNAVEIILVTPETLKEMTPHLDTRRQNWIKNHSFKATPGSFLIIPDDLGGIHSILWGTDDNPWQFANLPSKLPEGTYTIHNWYDNDINLACLTWTLSAYEFDTYKKPKAAPSTKLVWPSSANKAWVETAATAIKHVRDLINTPACDLTPVALSEFTKNTFKPFKSKINIIKGQSLAQDYPAVFTVGKAAAAEPLLIDMTWAHPKAQKRITIVGKGVCFDSGGLDIKPSSAMLTMKKDMGGAAHALALSYMIMALNLPLAIRVLIPAVENAISGNAMHPMDIIKTRKGLTVEVGNTDAEGRLILADALFEASQDHPDLIIDFATLTGAARIALGTELPALFTNNSTIAAEFVTHGLKMNDPVWHMPLHKPYKKHLKSAIADLSSTGKSSYGGAITAALFLEHFIDEAINWIHIDQMDWNLSSSPGKPEGGEAMGLLAAFSYIASLTN